MNIFFSGIFYLIEFYVAFDIFTSLWNERFKRIYTTLAGIGFYAITFLFFNLIENIYVNMIAFCVLNIAYILFAFKSNIVKAALLSAYLLFLIMATEVLVIKGFSTDLTGSFSINESNITYFATSMISKLLYFICGKLTLLFFSRRIRNKSSDIFLLFLPAVSAVQFTIFIVMFTHYKFSVLYSCLILVGTVINIIAIILTFIFYNRNTEELKKLYNAKNEADRAVTDLAYYEILNEQNEKLKEFMHDEKNHLLVIKSIADNDEVSRYIDSVYNDIKFHSIFGNTKNKYLDLLLNKYNSICKTNEIHFEVTVKTANLSFMQPNDLICVVSNILDNATKAAMASKKKIIDFSINSLNDTVFLECVNSCDNPPKINGNVLETLKRDKENHGYGIKSIKSTVKKYKGEFDWKWIEEEKLFKTRCVFSVEKT